MHNDTPVKFKDWVQWLESRHLMPLIAPGLDRTVRAIEHAGLTDRYTPHYTIHITGTNGKGTTAKALEFLIDAASESVGLFTSPHLVSTCERISVNKTQISEGDFTKLCEKHRSTIEFCELTHFEALTLMALDYFATIKKTKWMIFEIGLGGLWDSTNAIDHATSVITTIGFDHTHILGKTLGSIAKNKFGIIKKNNLVIHQTYPDEIQSMLQDKLRETGAIGVVPRSLEFVINRATVPNYEMIYNNRKIPLTLPGKRSVENMATAITTFCALGFSDEHVSKLSGLQWVARMTELQVPGATCPVYISGDHNEQGILSLCELLQQSTYEQLFVVLGLSKNRSHDVFVDHLKKLRDVSLIYTAPKFQGVLPDSNKYAPYFESSKLAVEETLRRAKAKDLVVVTGSLYLCGDLLAHWPTPAP